MKLYNHFEVISEIRNINDGNLEILGNDGLIIRLSSNELKASKSLLKKGRIICVMTDQEIQGRYYFVYVQVLAKDFGKNGWFENNREYYFNPRTQLENCPEFILVWQK